MFNVTKKHVGEEMVGRVLSFDNDRGYGFIRVSTGEDIFLSSYEVSKADWKHIYVGDYVKFKVGIYDNGRKESIVAQNVVFTKKMPRRMPIYLPNEEELQVKDLRQFAKRSLLSDGVGKLFPNFPARAFNYVLVKTPWYSYVFNSASSPIVFDGTLEDVKAYYRYLTDLLARYDIERDYRDIKPF